ncbi:hypothetical protein A5715_17375 [Mycolicibacter heraklionensis]|nr:hypothetical protein A5715_17375 [Mycolicibacter heraklionensis]
MKTGTRAEQRVATRQALVAAAVQQLRTEGIAAVTTRRVAGAAGVSQSTVMYHFPSRDDLVTAAVAQIALELADQARVHFEETAATTTLDLSGFLDLIWREFTTPQALSVAYLWAACWTDPQVAETVKSLEKHMFSLAVAAAEALPAPAPGFDPAAFMDTVVVLIRGLVISIPVWGLEFISAHWEISKANLLKVAGVPAEL